MKKLLLISILALAGCQHPTHTSTPELSGAIGKAGNLSTAAQQAAQDSKQVKAALGELRASNEVLSRINGEQSEILDRMDYKTTKLLQK